VCRPVMFSFPILNHRAILLVKKNNLLLSSSVTLGDEEAKKHKVQKTILERKGPPTFSCAVEMISRTECRVHCKLETTVDAILAGNCLYI
jgi:hypothetical protein